jgi:hypothetical protein
MESDIQPLPAPVRRHDIVTGVMALLLTFGPIAVPCVVFGRQALESGEWPLQWRAVTGVLIFLGMPAWLMWRTFRFGRVCRCPQCGGYLRAERPGRQGTTLLVCRACGVTWDSGGGHYENRHPSECGG